MSRHLPLTWVAALGSMAALAVSAQPAPQAPAPADLGPQAQTVPYRSSLGNYQPFADEKVLPWRQVNDTVGQIGGWRAYAKEAHEPAGKDDSLPERDSGLPLAPDAKAKGRP